MISEEIKSAVMSHFGFEMITWFIQIGMTGSDFDEVSEAIKTNPESFSALNQCIKSGKDLLYCYPEVHKIIRLALLCPYISEAQKRYLEEPYTPPPKQKPKPREGFVYLMRDNRNGATKIGFSKNPTTREKTLQSEVPSVEMIAAFKSNVESEAELHQIFADKRIRGEWFSLTKEDIDEIRYLFHSPTKQEAGK